MPNAPAEQTAHRNAMELDPETELGLAMLVAEDEDGATEPINIVTTVGEARELAQEGMRLRMARLDRGEDAGICPFEYKVWARDAGGRYVVVASITV